MMLQQHSIACLFSTQTILIYDILIYDNASLGAGALSARGGVGLQKYNLPGIILQ
jgi:hypothetical protein